MGRDNDIAPVITARSLCDHCVGLAIHLADCERDSTGTYADAARYDIGQIEDRLAQIKAAVAKMPTLKKEAA